jgi:hypothetical protein
MFVVVSWRSTAIRGSARLSAKKSTCTQNMPTASAITARISGGVSFILLTLKRMVGRV